MTEASLSLDIAGERWAVDVPERWAERFRTAFRHLVVDDDREPALRITARESPTREESAWAGKLVGRLPEVDGIAAIREGAGRAHVSRMSIESWDAASGRGESILLDPLYESKYLGTNLLINQIVWRALRRGLVPVHAAAIGNDAGFWLIPAAAGQGKSTLAAAATAAGLRFLGDDFVLLDAERLELHSLYAVLRLAPPSFRMVEEHFGKGRLDIVAEREDEKLLLTPSGADQDPCRRGGPLRGIFILDRTGTVRLGAAATPAQALRAFASTLRLLPSLGYPASLAFPRLGDLTRRIESRILETGSDLGALVRCVAEHMVRRG